MIADPKGNLNHSPGRPDRVKSAGLALLFIFLAGYGQVVRADEALAPRVTQIKLANGEMLDIPIPPGMTRLDGVPEIDKFILEGARGYVAYFASDAQKGVNFFLYGFGPSSNVDKFPHANIINVSAYPTLMQRKIFESKEEKFARLKKNWGRHYMPNGYLYGNVPDTIFVSVGPLDPLKRREIVALTYLNGNYIRFDYLLMEKFRQEMSEEEVSLYEQQLLDFVVTVREKYFETNRRVTNDHR